jgi:hypothetical protein
MNKRMKRESPSSEAGMMGNINENGKSEQNNNGENIDQSGNGSDPFVLAISSFDTDS